MSVAISFESHNGSVDAFVLGSPGLRATGKNRFEAESALRSQLEDRIRMGDVKFLELRSPSTFASRAAALSEEDRQAWAEVSAEIYRERDAEKAAEFPECS